MIAEAIEKVEELARQALRLRDLKIGDTRSIFYDRQGEIVAHKLRTPNRRHTVDSIESFAAAVEEYAVAEGASVWVNTSAVVAIIDDRFDSYRDETVTLPIQKSACFAVLARQNWCEQKTLVDTLRHDLAGATIGPANTLSVLRNLKFSTNSELTGKLTNSSAAMGKSVESQVTGEAALPESVSVEFHPFPSLAGEVDRQVLVMCTLFTDPARGLLKLAPQQGELEKATVEAAKALREAVARHVTGGHKIFSGTP